MTPALSHLFFKFSPILKSVTWGGKRIFLFKGIDSLSDGIGESWEISGIAGRESVISAGEEAGSTISKLIEKYGRKIVGTNNFERYGTSFPLLIKFIDAASDLSVQVHPDDAMAQEKHGCSGKTEMWYIIDSKPGAMICNGLNRDITPEDYERLVADNDIMSVIAQQETHAGDFYYLPAGRIHSICAGNLLLEIQQASDISYRIYDFNRKDNSGNGRELHTELAKQALDYTKHVADSATPVALSQQELVLVKSPFFNVHKVIVDGNNIAINMPKDSFLAVSCVSGAAEFSAQVTDGMKDTVTLKQGETMLVAADTDTLTASGSGEFITATV